MLNMQYVIRRTLARVGIAVRGSRWGLPWICALVMASSLAYGLNTAVSGGPVGRAVQPSISAAQTSADPDRSLIPSGCRANVADPMYARVDMDSSIVAECRLEMCGRVALMSAARSESSARCDANSRLRAYVGLNTRIPAETSIAPCPDGWP